VAGYAAPRCASTTTPPWHGHGIAHCSLLRQRQRQPLIQSQGVTCKEAPCTEPAKPQHVEYDCHRWLLAGSRLCHMNFSSVKLQHRNMFQPGRPTLLVTHASLTYRHVVLVPPSLKHCSDTTFTRGLHTAKRVVCLASAEVELCHAALQGQK
jgi:hypothetical protein